VSADELAPNAVPPEFGGSWEAFVREWCLGAPLGYEQKEAVRGLRALQRLFPAEVSRLAKTGPRGVGPAAAAVDLGTLLDTCAPLAGFDDVLRRLVTGERSAYSELVLVTTLARLGLSPRFAVPIDGSVLDACCTIEDRPVYFEVVAPEWSEALVAEQRSIDHLVAEVQHEVTKCRVEIDVYGTLDRASTAAILSAIRSAPCAEWVTVGSAARIRRIDAGQLLQPLFDGDGAQIFVAGDRVVQGTSASVIARRESSDLRAQRVLDDKRKQLSRGVANLVVVNVSAVLRWDEAVARTHGALPPAEAQPQGRRDSVLRPRFPRSA